MPPDVPPRLLRAAASTATASYLRGDVRAGRVAAATRQAVFVEVVPRPREAGPALLSLVGYDAVHLPCSMVLSSLPPPLDIGMPASVGGGRLRVGDKVVTPSRWWRVPRPSLADPPRAVRVAAALATPHDADALPAEIAGPSHALIEALTCADDTRLAGAIRAVLGLGPGLTPAGDDVLAGALVALAAADPRAHARLAAAVMAHRPVARTTLVSAAILGHAARGECVPQVAALLAALDGRGAVDDARRRLAGVGHTSGTALTFGVVHTLAGLAGSTAPTPRRNPQ